MTTLLDAFKPTNPRYAAYLRAGGKNNAYHSFVDFIHCMKQAFPGTHYTGHFGRNHGTIQDHTAFTRFIDETVDAERVVQAESGRWEIKAE
ncbi:hypothetical protein [Marinobacterium litorale]|uniref:hypothetical protein n=1 Tax=Marinobacterium litorale TaxID=404770 RepID=UPI000415E697|nr:hypothetical protein [Marinobacterium litorale]